MGQYPQFHKYVVKLCVTLNYSYISIVYSTQDCLIDTSNYNVSENTALLILFGCNVWL